jgi:hypothetical protein
MKTITGKPLRLGDSVRFSGSKQRYVVVVAGEKRMTIARHIEIEDGTTLIHSDETDPQNRPARLMGDA